MNGMTGGARRRRTHLRRQIAGRLRVLLAVLVLAGCSVVERPASHRLRDEIARIRAADEPLTFEQLRAGHSSRSWARTAPAPGAARPCPEQRASRTCARDARAVGARARIDRPGCAE